MSEQFDLTNFRQALRPEKTKAVNELGAQAAVAILEMGRRMDLRPDEMAMAMLGAVSIVLRNRGGPTLLPRNMRSFSQKLHEYALVLEARQAQPTDDILEN